MGCDICGKLLGNLRLSTGGICKNCFEEKYGTIIRWKGACEYLGGHSNHEKGGSGLSSYTGICYLTNSHFIYVQQAMRRKNWWQIIIPHTSIILDYWDNTKFEIPYIDENSKMQKPKFDGHHTGLSRPSSNQKERQKWIDTLNDCLIGFQQKKLFEESKKPAEEKPDPAIPQDKSQELYDKLDKKEITMEEYVEEIEKIDAEIPIENKQTIPEGYDEKSSDENPLNILKTRYAKGEIPKKEFESMKKDLEE